MSVKEQMKRIEQLKDKYGEERTEEQPRIQKSGLIPDLLVYKTDDKEEILLIVETTTFENRSRREDDIEQLKTLLDETKAQFGAVVSEEEDYIFRNFKEDGESYEVTRSGFPELENEKEPLENFSEFNRLYRRVRDQKRVEPNQFLEALLLKLEADRQEIKYEDIVDKREELIEGIESKNPSFYYTDSLKNEELLTVAAVFNRINLDETREEIAEKIPEILTRNSRLTHPKLSQQAAEELVSQMELKDIEEVTVAFSSYGTLARELDEHVTNVKAVEINPEINNIAILFDELLDHDIEKEYGDPLAIIKEKSTSNIVGLPPLGLNLREDQLEGYERNHPKQNVAETIISIGMHSIADDGRLYVLATTGLLYRRSADWLRKEILDNNYLESLTEIKDPILSQTSVPTVLFSLKKDKETQDIELKTLSKDSGHFRVEDRLKVSYADLERTMIPSNLIHWKKWKNADKMRNEEFFKLSEVGDVKSGNRKPEGKADEGMPFIGLSGYEGDKLDKEQVDRTAEDGDLLLAIRGNKVVSAIPKKEVAPSQSWAIISFEANDLNLKKLAKFFHSEPGYELLESIRKGSTIPRINISDLREIELPLHLKTEVEMPETLKKIEDDYTVVYRSH